MESPTISRSPSQTFGPSRGRRSHTNVHHLSLAPLTPKYPIDPHDYDAYFDPSSQQLHTSASLSQIASLPSPGGILTPPARSRNNSRVRKKTKSSVSIRVPVDVPSGALTSEGFGHKKKADPSWLIQTGLALTEGSRETKGQSWITKRDSSTSLHTPEEPRKPRSRTSSRRRSKKDLSMTPAAVTPLEQAEPDWADSHTQAELAAQAAEDDDDVLLALDYDGEDGDYDLVDFTDNFDPEDEEEVRQAISKYKLGQWFDDAVNVMLKLEDDMPDRRVRTGDPSVVTIGEIEPPPDRPKSIWEDMAWFGRLLARTARS